MRPAFIVVGVAAVAACAATALLIMEYMDAVVPPPAATEASAPVPPPVVTVGVLVAAAPLEVGKTLDSTVLEWQQWPEAAATAVGQAGAVIAADENARAERLRSFEGTVSRVALLKGEVLTEEKVLRPGTGSTLAVVLAPGHRSVTIQVDAISGAGGMIQPGDRVDLMLTADVIEAVVDPLAPARPKLATETILTNLKIIGTDRRLTANTAPETPAPATVTVEVTPEQAERIVTAQRMGRFTLAMRPLATGPELERDGLAFTTDFAIMPQLRAARMGISADKLDPRQNPFGPAPRAMAQSSPGAAASARPEGVTIYNATAATFVPMVNGRPLPPGTAAPPPQVAEPSMPSPQVPERSAGEAQPVPSVAPQTASAAVEGPDAAALAAAAAARRLRTQKGN